MNLYAERINRGLTIGAVAEACNVSRQTLLKAESGDMPYPPQAKRIADFYERKVTDIWPVDDAPDEVAA